MNEEQKFLPEGVSLLRLTSEKLRELWEKLKDFDRLYTDTTHGDELSFYKKLMAGDMIVFETEGGIMILDHLTEHEFAQVHVSFWDRKLSEKSELIRGTMKWCFETFGLERLEALIPEFSKALSRFLTKRMGFSYEGTLRKRLLYHGEFKDILIYSILREEALNG